MEYFTNIVRATRSALKSAHTEFNREMYVTTPVNTTTTSNNTQVPQQQKYHDTSQTLSNDTNTPTHSVPTITTSELNQLRQAIYNNTLSMKK